MTSLVQIFRFLFGLGMVVAGGFVAAPFISSVLSSAAHDAATQNGPQQTNPAGRDKTSQSIPNFFAVPVKSPEGTRVIRQIADPSASGLSQLEDSSLPSQPHSVAPERMPRRTLGNAPPGLYGAYHTTVEMPPPPLLDGPHTFLPNIQNLTKRLRPDRHQDHPRTLQL